MRYPIIVACAFAISACQTTQTVIVQTATTQTIEVVRDPVPRPAKGTVASTPKMPKPTEESGKPNPRDLDAVSKYCEQKASEIYDKLPKSEQYEKLRLMHFKGCLKTFGWREAH